MGIVCECICGKHTWIDIHALVKQYKAINNLNKTFMILFFQFF